MALVEIRPIEKQQWHGKKGKESFARPKSSQVLVNADTMKYATGLTEEEAKKYGALMGVDLSDTYTPDEAHPYWTSKAAAIVLPNATFFLNTEKPQEYVKLKNMKASKLVANSLKEWENGEWPSATHIIYDESEEMEAKASKIQLKNKAIKQALDLSLDAKIALIQVIRNKNMRNQSPNFVDVELDDILDKEPKLFLDYHDMGKEEIQLRATVLELIQKGILTKDGTAIYYLGDQLGFDYDATLAWFRAPENQKMKIAIFEKLNR